MTFFRTPLHNPLALARATNTETGVTLFIHDITADKRQPWMNYENNGNEYLIIGTVVRSEYSNIQYKHLIIGNV